MTTNKGEQIKRMWSTTLVAEEATSIVHSWLTRCATVAACLVAREPGDVLYDGAGEFLHRLVDAGGTVVWLAKRLQQDGLLGIVQHRDPPDDNVTHLYKFYSTYPQDVVQVLCLPPTTLNLLMNASVHPYSVFYVVFISQIIFFLLITSIQIFILRAACTHTGGRYCTHDISIVFIF